MQVWCLHNRVRYAFIPPTGKVVLFEFSKGEHLAAGIETVGEIRTARSASFILSGRDVEADSREWAKEIADLVKEVSGKGAPLAIDVVDPHMLGALECEGVVAANGTELMERARWHKDENEILAIREAITVCEVGMTRMQAVLRPGVTENFLLSVLAQTNIELGGEWLETRLLTSGPKTKPWLQECGDRIIQEGDLVSFDTDLIGPNGYCADISRSWLCGDRAASGEQKLIYQVAYEQLQHNLELMHVGTTFREVAERAYKLPKSCEGTYYFMIAHGVGLCDEAPIIRHLWDVRSSQRDDEVLEAGMVMSIEALVALDEGREAVKLEQMIHITPTGPELLSSYPFEDRLLH